MNPSPLLPLVETLLQRHQGEPTPADQLLDQLFRSQRGLSSSERHLIADLFFILLRQDRYLTALAHALLPDGSPPPPPWDGLAVALTLFFHWTPQQIGDHVSDKISTEWLSRLPLLQEQRAALEAEMPPAHRFSLPDWLWQNWCSHYGQEESSALAHQLNQPTGVDLRVNTLRGSREQLRAGLTAVGLETLPTPFSPHGLRLTQRQPLQGLELFQRGWFELQDEGSQLIAPLLAPQPGQRIIDLCAGSGGKSLHLAALMKNRGEIIATDNTPSRLQNLRKRAERAGIKIIQSIPLRHERDPKIMVWADKADGVLVDAPCSGSGTLRRNPGVKWRIDPDKIRQESERQYSLLTAGSRLVRPGGRLVYATCSLQQEENQAVVELFLRENRHYHLLSALDQLQRLGIHGIPAQAAPYLALLPHQTGTDGFFAALLQRKR